MEPEFIAGKQEDRTTRPCEGSCIKLPHLLHRWCEKIVHDTKMTPPGVMSQFVLYTPKNSSVGSWERDGEAREILVSPQLQ